MEKHELDVQKNKIVLDAIRKSVENAEGEAKRILEEKLKEEEEKQKDRINSIQKEKDELNKKQEELKKKREGIKKASGTLLKDKIKAALEKYSYNNRYNNLYYDKNSGYIKFNNHNKEDKYLHRYLYRSVYGYYIPKGHHVHHIDVDKLNNDAYNLIALSGDKHRRLNHGKIQPMGDWKKGIHELMSQLNISKSELPIHIQKHLEKI